MLTTYIHSKIMPISKWMISRYFFTNFVSRWPTTSLEWFFKNFIFIENRVTATLTSTGLRYKMCHLRIIHQSPVKVKNLVLPPKQLLRVGASIVNDYSIGV